MCATPLLLMRNAKRDARYAPIASFHIRPQEFYYRKIRYERHMTLHPVALPALSFVWQSMGKTPEVRVKQQLAPEKNLASFYNLHSRKATFTPVRTMHVLVKNR